MTESGATTGPESGGAGAAALEFGTILREFREGKNLKLSDIASALKIREVYLEAIEGGKFDDLPGPTYAAGFVRAYAIYLGLEIDEVMRRYNTVTAHSSSHSSLAPLSLTAEARLPTARVLLVAGILAASTYSIWYYLTVRGQSATEVISALPETMSDSARLSNQANKNVISPIKKLTSDIVEKQKKQSSIVNKAVSQKLAIKSKEFTTTILPSKAHKPPQLKTKNQSSKKLEEKRLRATTQSQKVSSEKKGIAGLLKPKSRIVLRANAASWVELRGAGGERLISRILKEGDAYQVPLKPGIKFSTGNAGGVDILVDGKIIVALGPIGAVRRDILLDPDALLARSPGQR